jgi:uncharacterized protein YqgQ
MQCEARNKFIRLAYAGDTLMTQDELKKLQQAAQLIKAGDYARARVILKTMPNSEKAQAWLLKLDEKEMFGADAPASAKNTATRPSEQKRAPVKASRKFSPVKFLLMLLGVVVVIVVTAAIVMEISDRQRAQAMLPEATTTMSLFCGLVWDYSPARCRDYANKFFEQDVKLVFRVNVCGIYMLSTNGLERFTNCMGSDLKVPSELGA